MEFKPTLEEDGSLSEATQKAIIEELHKLTDEYSIEKSPAEHRRHLGASVIGEKCRRKLWYMFRWVKLAQFEGRMRRLFNRGHREEPEVDRMLLWMGFYVREIDPETNKQYKFSAVNGHYGGSGDGIAITPWFRDEKQRILIEKKTHNDRLFNQLKTGRLITVQPKHYAQMCTYGKAFKLRYGLYIAINKNDDDIHYEFLELDWNYAIELEKKASDIIYAQEPPIKISENPAFFDCKYCDFVDICHWGEAVEKNCRSCKLAVPTDNAEWFCNRFNSIIPKDFIHKGCDGHTSVNE